VTRYSHVQTEKSLEGKMMKKMEEEEKIIRKRDDGERSGRKDKDEGRQETRQNITCYALSNLQWSENYYRRNGFAA
jgi:hypothetical protein